VREQVVVRALWVALGLLAGSLDARAQDLDAGKTPAQLFSSHCSACHRTPQGLVKQSFGLAGFLRQHYTSSAATASALAAYVAAAGPDPRAARVAPEAQRGRREVVERPAPSGGDPRILREPAAQAGTPQPSPEPPKPRQQRDPRLAVAVSTDPQPFLILRDPIPVPPDPTPRRAPTAAVPAAPELRPSLPDTAATRPAPAPGDQPAAAAIPAADPAPTTTAGLSGDAAPAPGPDTPGKVSPDQPTFSAPLP
jgi:hypothetical protein